MKLTPVKLYTVNYHGDGALDASESVWAATAESAARMFAFAHPWNDARFVMVMHPDGDQTYRIDPDPDLVESFVWVPGLQPADGKCYLARCLDTYKAPYAAVVRFSSGQAEFVAPYDFSQTHDTIPHHNPTPISLEIP